MKKIPKPRHRERRICNWIKQKYIWVSTAQEKSIDGGKTWKLARPPLIKVVYDCDGNISDKPPWT